MVGIGQITSNSNTRFQLLGNLTGIGCKMDAVTCEKAKRKKNKSQNSLPIYYTNRIESKNGFSSKIKHERRKEKNRCSDRDYPRISGHTVPSTRVFCRERTFPRTLRHSKPNCRYLPRTCCPVEKRDASAWTAPTPPAIFDKGWRGRCRYGDTRRPRGAARGSLPESASPATSPSFLGITS